MHSTLVILQVGFAVKLLQAWTLVMLQVKWLCCISFGLLISLLPLPGQKFCTTSNWWSSLQGPELWSQRTNQEKETVIFFVEISTAYLACWQSVLAVIWDVRKGLPWPRFSTGPILCNFHHYITIYITSSFLRVVIIWDTVVLQLNKVNALRISPQSMVSHSSQI